MPRVMKEDFIKKRGALVYFEGESKGDFLEGGARGILYSSIHSHFVSKRALARSQMLFQK
jgi:hypothetical protein